MKQSDFFVSAATITSRTKTPCKKKKVTHEIIHSNSGTKNPSKISTFSSFPQIIMKNTWDFSLWPTKKGIITFADSRQQTLKRWRWKEDQNVKEKEQPFRQTIPKRKKELQRKTKGKFSVNSLKTIHIDRPDQVAMKSHDLTVDSGLGKT